MRKRGVVVHSMDCGEDLASEKWAAMLMSVLRAMETFEADVPRARMRSRKQQQKSEGRYLGGNPPFGYTVDKNGNLRVEPRKLRALNLMKKRKSQGLSLRVIATELTKRGIKISHSGVASVLRAANPNNDELQD
jgi:DNA invertase Pin-like site-specific DNA recombinase